MIPRIEHYTSIDECLEMAHKARGAGGGKEPQPFVENLAYGGFALRCEILTNEPIQGEWSLNALNKQRNHSTILCFPIHMPGQLEHTLDERQLETISDLVAIPSATRAGETKVLDYIEERLSSVTGLRVMSRAIVEKDALVVEKGCPIEEAHTSILIHGHVDTVPGEARELTLNEIKDNAFLLSEVLASISKIVPAESLESNASLETLLKQRGQVGKIRRSLQSILGLHAQLEKRHRDEPDSWPDRHELKIDRDYAAGLGAGDMKAAVAIMMWLAEEAELPEGVHLTFAFLRDEELLSRGAAAVQDWIRKERRKYHFCLSSDVEPRPDSEVDKRQRIIIARRGAAKIEGFWTIPKHLFGHSATSAVNAIDSILLFQRDLRKEFEKHAYSHLLFADEQISPEMIYADARGGMVPGYTAQFAYKVFLNPPQEEPLREWLGSDEKEKHISGVDILNFALYRQRLCTKHILESTGWEDLKGITCDLALAHPGTNLSYPPFEANKSHPLVKLLARTAKHVAHPREDVQFIGASSNADANLFDSFFRDHQAELGMKEPTVTLDLPYIAYGTHSTEERVNTKSVATVFAILKEFLKKLGERKKTQKKE